MSETVAHLLAEIERLPLADRAEIASAVLSGLGAPVETTPDGLEATLARRIAEIRAGAVEGRLAEEVFARLHARRQ